MKANIKAMKSRKSRANKNVQMSSGNVFADLGFRNAAERLLRTKLATKTVQLIEKKGWTQAQTAERTALDQPKVSRLLRGQLSGFSTDRLFEILQCLGHRNGDSNLLEA
jgi:predicted XRE-type DNA-binding protein